MAVDVVPRWSDRYQHGQVGEPVRVAALENWPFHDENTIAWHARLESMAIVLLAAGLSLWPSMTGRDARTAPATSRPADGAKPADDAQPAGRQQPAERPQPDWAGLADTVRERFALAAAVQNCQHTENLYGYELLLAAVPSGRRAALVAARNAGASEAVSPLSDPDQCGANLDKLAAADDRLVVLAEKVKRDQP